MDARYALSSYAFHLPDDRIAQTAAHPPESAKMLVFDRSPDLSEAAFLDRSFDDLPSLAGSDRLFVFNDTRVIPSRVAFRNAAFTNREGFRREKAGEIFFLKESSEGRFEALVFPGAAFSVGSVVEIGDFRISVESKIPDGRVLRILSGGTVHEFLARYGRLPLPPYVEYSDEKARDYQTAFAKNDGSLAAPTASLHFTESLLSRIRERGSSAKFLTLHVGLGTFKPMKADDIRDHVMHPEYFEVPASVFADVAQAKIAGKRVVGVGTTVIRTLESLPFVWRDLAAGPDGAFSEFRSGLPEDVRAFWDGISAHAKEGYFPGERLSASPTGISGETVLFLMPGSEFLVVDEIVTNFHLPESTLFVLVSAFAGMEKARAAYDRALSGNYRFYSFGDGMWIRKA